MKLINKLFSIKSNHYYKKIRILGILIKLQTIKNAFTRSMYIDFIEKINGSQHANPGDNLYILRNKSILLNRIKHYLKRDFLVLDKENFEEFESFAIKNPIFIAKDMLGSGGNNIIKINVSEYGNKLQQLFSLLLEKETTLLEGFIQQHSLLDKIHSNSVTTIRITTLNIGGNVEIVLSPLLRIGINDKVINSQEAIVTRIDINTHKTYGPSLIIKEGNFQISKQSIHPNSNIKITDIKIPFFDEVVKLAKETALLIPEISFIGWDIALTESGPVVVEGNGGPVSYIDEELISQQGLKDYFNNLINFYNFNQNFNQNEFDNINKKLFIKSEKPITNPDFVLILGSQNCSYRGTKAVELYKNNKDVIFIASGGNKCINGKYEYETIKDILLENGISEHQILTDSKSISTKSNLKQVLKHIENNGKTKNISITIITAGFHSSRTEKLSKKILKNHKFQIIKSYGKDTHEDNWHKNLNGFIIIQNELKKLR